MSCAGSKDSASLCNEGHAGYIRVDMSVVLEARAKLNFDKMPGSDDVCPEGLRALSWNAVLGIAQQVEQRVNCPWLSDAPESWTHLFGMCVPKEARPHRLSQ